MSTLWSERNRFRAQAGLTLLEMILFIVVLGVAAVAMLAALSGPLSGAGTQTEVVTAAQVAQARMEVMLGYKRKNGFPSDDLCEPDPDPCPGPAVCATPAGWTVDTACEAWTGNGDTSAFQVFVVTANGPASSYTMRTLVTRLGNGS